MPYYRGWEYLSEAVESLQAQTLQGWELLIVAEKDHDAEDLFARFVQMDERIRILINPGIPGIAASLNYGMEQAVGEYIARMDADDISLPQRLEKQVAYMDAHPECGVCGTWQRYFGGEQERLHCPPAEHEDIRASLIFNCEMCHSTVMLRKCIFEENALRYDGSYAAEDYELWTRAIRVTRFHNLPEVLGEYRWNGQNITQGKMDILSAESAQMTAKNLMDNLGIAVSPVHIPFLNGWRNEIAVISVDSFAVCRAAIRRERTLLAEIWTANQTKAVYQQDALLRTLSRRWKNADRLQRKPVRSIEQLLRTYWRAVLFYAIAYLRHQIKKRLCTSRQ